MPLAIAQFDIQGHRGCRGLLPENTVPAFIRAVELGVTTLELDVVITADHQVLVSHDPYMSHEICLLSEGDSISKSQELNHNIYKMNSAQTRQYDCGSVVSKRFPNQEKFKVYKPLLQEVIDSVEKYIADHKLPPVSYNIETKCKPATDGIFHPSPEVFADLLMEVVERNAIQHRTFIQSFDARTLLHLHQKKAPVKLVLLVENFRSSGHNIKRLGFNPDVYSPYYKLVTARLINSLHAKGIKIIPWTVNETQDMQKLIGKGVDGIITDYPDRLIQLVRTLPQ